MKRIITLFTFLALMGLFVGSALAQDLIVYPAKGQSQDQMEKDKFECYSWAKSQTGFDPMQMPTATAAPPPKAESSVAGGAVKGGAGGALLGLGVGAITGSAKKGAAIGALSGGAIGGMRSSSQNRQAEQARRDWEQQQANQYMQQRNKYNRAYSACLEGKGYTVK
jgi:outer membrane lipoprotein SlyB